MRELILEAPDKWCMGIFHICDDKKPICLKKGKKLKHRLFKYTIYYPCSKEELDRRVLRRDVCGKCLYIINNKI